MSDVWESGSGLSGRAVYPLLVECDRQGRILWMSEEARSVLGATYHLADIVLVSNPPYPAPTICIVRLLEQRGRVLICLSISRALDLPARQQQVALLIIQSSFLQHYFRLQNAERVLSRRLTRRRRGRGLQTVFQLERERQRLGRELHTGVGQMLAAIRLQLEIIATQGYLPPPPVSQALGRISTLAGEALEQVRSVSRRLHPPEWQRLTLEAALQQLWEISGIPESFQATLSLDRLPHEPSLAAKVLLYRAAQEALSNLTRHSRASRIDMTLRLEDDHLVLTIQDNGVGFDVEQHLSAPATVASGIGLRSIREQADAIGAKFLIQSGEFGTKLVVSTLFTSEKS